MPVGLVPIDEAASVLRVDFHVVGTAHAAAVLDSSRLDDLGSYLGFVCQQLRKFFRSAAANLVVEREEPFAHVGR